MIRLMISFQKNRIFSNLMRMDFSVEEELINKERLLFRASLHKSKSKLESETKESNRFGIIM